MAHITKKDVLHLASLARIRIDQNEVIQFTRELEDILAYASSLQKIAENYSVPEQTLDCSMNVMREDEIVSFPAQKILDQAPEREEDYFVVPRIIKRS